MAGTHFPRRTPILQDILHHEKNEVNYKFISRYITIYEAEEIFKQGVERGRRFEALLNNRTREATPKVNRYCYTN